MGKSWLFVQNNQISGRIIRQNDRIPDIRQNSRILDIRRICLIPDIRWICRIPDIRFSKSRIPDIRKSGKSQYPATGYPAQPYLLCKATYFFNTSINRINNTENKKLNPNKMVATITQSLNHSLNHFIPIR